MPARVSESTDTMKRETADSSRVFFSDVQLSSDLGNDIIALSQDLYEDIHGKGGHKSQPSSLIAEDAQEHAYVSVKSVSGFPADTQQWVLFCSKADKNLKPSTCVLSSASHSSLILSTSVLLRRTTPVEIEHAVLTFPPEIYEQADKEFRAGEGQILERVCRQSSSIVRQGDYDSTTGCKVRICEPVDQGILVRGKTEFTVVKRNDASPSSLPSLAEHDVELEISDFLAGDFDTLASTLDCDLYPLPSPMNLETLIPRPDPSADPEAMGFVKVEVLGRLGCFSGDTVSQSFSTLRNYTVYTELPKNFAYLGGRLQPWVGFAEVRGRRGLLQSRTTFCFFQKTSLMPIG